MVSLDLDRYRDRIEASRQRIEIASRFEEPDRVPIAISVAGSFYCSLFGYEIGDYYTDLDLQIDAQHRGQQWAFEALGDDRTGAGIHLDIGPIAEGVLFDCEIVRPRGTSPWIVHRIHDIADIERLEVPDPEAHPGVQEINRRGERLREEVERRGIRLPAGGGFGGIHPPLSAACALADPALIYQWMYTEPEWIKVLFDKLLAAYCRCLDYSGKRAGRAIESVGLADDHSAFVSNEMYRAQVLPYNRAIYERYGAHGRYLHADGPNDHHFALYADELRITRMDIGGFSDIAAAKSAMHGRTVISGGLNCRDLYRDFEAARPAVERAIRIGAPGGGYIFGVGGETYAGVNPDTLIRVVEYAKRIGRYPITIAEVSP
jgi:uroporphyrinogen-III decarboxylase